MLTRTCASSNRFKQSTRSSVSAHGPRSRNRTGFLLSQPSLCGCPGSIFRIRNCAAEWHSCLRLRMRTRGNVRTIGKIQDQISTTGVCALRKLRVLSVFCSYHTLADDKIRESPTYSGEYCDHDQSGRFVDFRSLGGISSTGPGMRKTPNTARSSIHV
jgi:hypothetical protein